MGVSNKVKGVPQAGEGLDGIQHNCSELVGHDQGDHADKMGDQSLQ